jgi:carbamoyl-phosphate synthase large subunit
MKLDKIITVLITAAGGASAMNCINALRIQKDLNVRIIGVDVNPYSAGIYQADNGYIIPDCRSPNYLNSLLKICEIEKVDVILPLHSSEIPVISFNQKLFEHHNIHLLIPSHATVSIFENKWFTYQFFRNNNFLTPNTFVFDGQNDGLIFPAVIKPIVGSGSKGCHRVNDQDDIYYFKKNKNQPCIVQEMLVGQEYTIDVLANNNHEVLAIIPRERIRVRDGMSVVTRTIDDERLYLEVERLVSVGKLVGPLNIQGFFVSSKFYFTEVNCRFAAGGLPLSVAAGANLPLLVIKLAIGLPVDRVKHFVGELVMLRYLSEVFIKQSDIKIDISDYEN